MSSQFIVHACRSASTRALSVSLAVLLCACAGPRGADGATPAADPAPTTALATNVAVIDPSQWPQAGSPLPPDPALEARIRALLDTMSVEEKVGQIVQGDLGSVTPEDVRRYRLGSVLAGGNSDPGGRYNAPARDWLALMDQYHAASMDTRDGGKAIPVLLGIDAVHGHNNVVGATLFPHNIGLGAANDPELVRRIAEATAVELRTTGFEWTFAPTLTVPRDDRWGRTYEGYSEDPALVARYAGAVVEGLQGRAGSDDFLDDHHVLASAKHFIGDGGTEGGKDQGDTRISEAMLRDIHGVGYVSAIKAGTQTVMASFSSWNGIKLHGSHELLNDVLKERMGFDGFVVGDWNAHGQLPGCSNENCAAAFNAGVDMLMAPDSWRGYYTHAVAQVHDGTIPMARLDDAVTRILRVKFRLGLFDAPPPSQRALGGHFEMLGSPPHRALARQAVRQSLVLLKNNGQLLPLRGRQRVLVAGDGANDIGKQSGGWTLSWQGTGNKRSDFPHADTIWQGIRAAVRAGGGTSTLSPTGTYDKRPDVAIVVFGENPYAEFQGDLPHLAYRPGDDADLQLLRRLKADGIPVVAVFLSGRPLWMNREINASDAFVAAWLPGSEGRGIADVLFAAADGRPAYDFSGRLSYSWPRSAAQSPLNVGQAGYDPQFALGHGLSYADHAELPLLPEDSGLQPAGAEPGVYFARGRAASGWTQWMSDGADNVVPLGALPTQSIDQRVRISAVDHLAQEDAQRYLWTGRGSAHLALRADQPVDLRRESNGDVMLVLNLRVDAIAADGDASIGIACGTDCSARVSVSPLLRAAMPGTWWRLGVPLKCFAVAGADLSKVAAFDLEAESALDISLSKVALGTDIDRRLDCRSQ